MSSTTTTFNPVHVLGTSFEQAVELLRGKPVTPGEAEAVAMRCYPWRRQASNPDSYWVTPGQAAEILGRSPQAVRQSLDRGRLPHAVHVSGVRLMRRADIESIAGRHVVPRQRASA